MDDVATRRNVYDVLAERGYIAEVSDEAGLSAALADPGSRPITLYVGFDATGTSLHVGHLLSIMALKHMQLHGHRPIALCGGGTTMIGDPTDKATTRPILTVEQIAHNLVAIRAQFARYLDFDSDQPNRALLVNNADWLLDLKYIEFLRDIGKHFTVNQMLSHSTYRNRLETGSLNFIEINYVLLQSYDFLHLYRELQLHIAVRRRRSMVQRPGRRRPDPACGRWAGVRCRDAAARNRRWPEDGQDRGRRDLARPGADLAIRVLPVLD